MLFEDGLGIEKREKTLTLVIKVGNQVGRCYPLAKSQTMRKKNPHSVDNVQICIPVVI